MNLKLNMKDINQILAKARFKWNFIKWYEETTHFWRRKSLWSCWKSSCHAFTSPSCSLREKSSLPVYCKCGEPFTLSTRASISLCTTSSKDFAWRTCVLHKSCDTQKSMDCKTKKNIGNLYANIKSTFVGK